MFTCKRRESAISFWKIVFPEMIVINDIIVIILKAFDTTDIIL